MPKEMSKSLISNIDSKKPNTTIKKFNMVNNKPDLKSSVQPKTSARGVTGQTASRNIKEKTNLNSSQILHNLDQSEIYDYNQQHNLTETMREDEYFDFNQMHDEGSDDDDNFLVDFKQKGFSNTLTFIP